MELPLEKGSVPPHDGTQISSDEREKLLRQVDAHLEISKIRTLEMSVGVIKKVHQLLSEVTSASELSEVEKSELLKKCNDYLIANNKTLENAVFMLKEILFSHLESVESTIHSLKEKKW